MDPDRWRKVAGLYDAAMDREPAVRDAFLSEACADDADLRREVESLLAQEHTSIVVDQQVHEVAAAVLRDLPRLDPGTAIGPYRVDSLIGAGGMGEIYRARDTKLNRDVALKILPEAFANDRDRMARFERESQVLASLNHPNIAAIYGVEERAIVMELVEAPTLCGLPLWQSRADASFTVTAQTLQCITL